LNPLARANNETLIFNLDQVCPHPVIGALERSPVRSFSCVQKSLIKKKEKDLTTSGR
jgi:hypothetical protein